MYHFIQFAVFSSWISNKQTSWPVVSALGREWIQQAIRVICLTDNTLCVGRRETDDGSVSVIVFLRDVDCWCMRCVNVVLVVRCHRAKDAVLFTDLHRRLRSQVSLSVARMLSYSVVNIAAEFHVVFYVVICAHTNTQF